MSRTVMAERGQERGIEQSHELLCTRTLGTPSGIASIRQDQTPNRSRDATGLNRTMDRAQSAASWNVSETAMGIELHGYVYSVYAWIARFALHEKGVEYVRAEINPFAADVPAHYLAMHPFGRVPVLVHDDFALYETTAITRYIDEAFDGPALQRIHPRERARCTQIVLIVDNYAYWPLVRQVFSHGYFRQRTGRPADVEELPQGMEATPRVLAALEAITSDGTHLCGDGLSIADIHLAPMIGYFVRAPGADPLLQTHPRLARWWNGISQRAAFRETIPQLNAD
jgi:glutathione S-transferase